MTTGRKATWVELAAVVVVSIALSLPVALAALPHINAPWGAGDMTLGYFLTSTWNVWHHPFTTQVAYPFGTDTAIFSGPEALQAAVLQFINWVASNPFAGLNVLLLLSFPLVALGAYGLMRMTGLRGPLVVALACTFTFIPFHFGRGIGHISFGYLFGVVSGMALALLCGSGRLEDLWRQATRRGRIGIILWVTGLVLVSTWTNAYYAIFAIILVSASVIWRLAHASGWRSLLAPLATLAALVLTFVLGLLPIAISKLHAGPNIAVAQRDPMEAVSYAGSLAITFIPQP